MKKIEIYIDESHQIQGVNILEHRPTGRIIRDPDGTERPEMAKQRTALGRTDDPDGFESAVAELIGENVAKAAGLQARAEAAEQALADLRTKVDPRA